MPRLIVMIVFVFLCYFVCHYAENQQLNVMALATEWQVDKIYM
jgi:hypothetical protein